MGFIPDDFSWQTAVAFAIIALAIGVLIRKAWQTIIGESTGCGTGCGSCPANGADTSTTLKLTPLVQIESTRESPK